MAIRGNYVAGNRAAVAADKSILRKKLLLALFQAVIFTSFLTLPKGVGIKA